MTPEAEAAHREPDSGTCWFCRRKVPWATFIAGYDTWDEQRFACATCDRSVRWLRDHGWNLSRAANEADAQALFDSTKDRIEREAAHRDSPRLDLLSAATLFVQADDLMDQTDREAMSAWSWEHRVEVHKQRKEALRAALAAEPIAASSRLDEIAAIAAALCAANIGHYRRWDAAESHATIQPQHEDEAAALYDAGLRARPEPK